VTAGRPLARLPGSASSETAPTARVPSHSSSCLLQVLCYPYALLSLCVNVPLLPLCAGDASALLLADPSYDNLQEVTVRSIPPQEPHPAGSYSQGLAAGR
jgi:hypothetical protein